MADIPDGINSPEIARLAVAWEMVKLAYVKGIDEPESQARLRNLVNAFIKADQALEKQTAITSE